MLVTYIRLWLPNCSAAFPPASTGLPVGNGQIICSSVQNADVHLIVNISRQDHITLVLRQLHWLPIRTWTRYKVAIFVFKVLHGPMLVYFAYDCRLINTGRQQTLRSTIFWRRDFRGATDQNNTRRLDFHCSRWYCLEQSSTPPTKLVALSPNIAVLLKSKLFV